jgi:hypothetical protein
MAERSQFWETSTTGDGAAAGYTEEQTIEWFRDIVAPQATSGPNTSQGVLRGVLGELAVTGTSSPVSVAAGAAAVEGFYYKSDAAVAVTVPTPVGGTRIDIIVLRASHGTTRTVRIHRIEGTPGAGAPSLTQSAGTTWDIPLAQLSVTIGGAITVTDLRTFCHFATSVSGSMLDADVADGTTLELSGTSVRVKDNGVSNAKLRDSAALSVIGRSTNSIGDPADIVAGSDGHVLRRSGTSLGFGQVTTAGLANDSVDDTKVGNRVPQFYRRQGSLGGSWLAPGTDNFIPGAVRMQAGAVTVPVFGSMSSTVTVKFPVAFSQVPLVFLTASVTDNYQVVHKFFYINETEFSFNVYEVTGHNMSTNFTMQWLAIGAE